MARVPDPMPNADAQTQELFDTLAAKRGAIDGMYRSLLNYPELCRHVSDLGTFLRFGNAALPASVRELVILWIAARLEASYEWVKHLPHARAAGVTTEMIEGLRTGKPLMGLSPTQEGALEVARCVMQHRSIPASIQDALVKEIGLKAVIELVILTGFYEMIAGVIFAFDVPLPAGEKEPFAGPP